MKNFFKKTSCYTTLPNSFAQDYRLSIEARGLGLLIFSLPDDWCFRQTWFYEKAGGDRNRRKTVVKALNELICFDYLCRMQDRKKGKFDGAIWFFDPEGNAQAELKAILTVGTDGTNGTVGTDSTGPDSASTKSTTTKEIETNEEIKKEENTPQTPQAEGGSIDSMKTSLNFSEIADLHNFTVTMIEDYIDFRLKSGGVKIPGAFEKHLVRELSEIYSSETVQLKEWYSSLQKRQLIDRLLAEFLSIRSHIFSRRECRERARDPFFEREIGESPSDVVIEIAFQLAEKVRRQQIGGAA